MTKITAAITAIGGYVPEYILTNEELERLVPTTSEWIESRTGIKERRILKQKIIVGPIDINEINAKKPNVANVTKTSDIKLGQTNVTTKNSTKQNLVTTSDQNNTGIMKQNSTTDKSGSASMLSISLAGGIFSKIKSKSDTSILAVILVGIYILSARIKEN